LFNLEVFRLVIYYLPE